MKKCVLLILGLSLLFAASKKTYAYPVTINLSATITKIVDNHNLLGVNIGDTLSGSYTFNALAPDSNSSENYGVYDHSDSEYGISISINNLIFQTDPNNVDFDINVANDIPEGDYYMIWSGNNLPVSQLVTVDKIYWGLEDFSGTALNSDALPVGLPDLKNWPDANTLHIQGKGNNADYFQYYILEAEVDSVCFSEPVPEPSTVFLLGLGFFGFAGSKFKKKNK